VATHEYVDMFRDVYHSTNWHDRWSFVLRGPGWAYQRHRDDAATDTAAGRPGSQVQSG